MLSIGALLAEINERIESANKNQEFIPRYVDELYAAKRTILAILEKNGESEDYHLKMLDTKG